MEERKIAEGNGAPAPSAIPSFCVRFRQSGLQLRAANNRPSDRVISNSRKHPLSIIVSVPRNLQTHTDLFHSATFIFASLTIRGASIFLFAWFLTRNFESYAKLCPARVTEIFPSCYFTRYAAAPSCKGKFLRDAIFFHRWSNWMIN